MFCSAATVNTVKDLLNARVEGFTVQLTFKLDARMHAHSLQKSTPWSESCSSNYAVHYSNLVYITKGHSNE